MEDRARIVIPSRSSLLELKSISEKIEKEPGCNCCIRDCLLRKAVILLIDELLRKEQSKFESLKKLVEVYAPES